jgi:hypothetical protein
MRDISGSATATKKRVCAKGAPQISEELVEYLKDLANFLMCISSWTEQDYKYAETLILSDKCSRASNDNLTPS